MATSTLRALNSLGGFSIGDDPQIVIIQANGDITSGNITANGLANINGNLIANFANFSGNVNISNANATWGLKTDNLYYSNGAPWDLSNPAGSNGYIQYNDNGAFGADANFQFTASTATLQVTGTSNVTGNLNVTQRINGNVANFSGNLTSLNASLGNLATANYVNIATDLLVSGNANIVLDLQGNTANFSGNIKALNANLGNLGTANFVNVSSNLNVTNTANVGNLNVAYNVTSNLIPNVSNTYTLGNATNMWKDLYLSGTSIYIGTQNITANGTAIAVSNDFASNNFFATNNVTANGNIYANAGGGAGYVYANFANVQSNLYVGANANIVNTLTAANIKDTNLSNTQIVFANAANTLSGSANFVFDATSNTLSVDNANLTGTLNGNIANFTGNLTALNANLGNLATANYVNVAANLVVSGNANFTSAANVALGAVGNVHITGGTAGYVLTTDGSGGLSWSGTAATNEIVNGNSNVLIATANGNVTITAGGTNTWTFGTDGKLTAAGDIQTNGTMNANAILSAYNITTTSGNINANSGVVNAGTANISGNISANNANITNTLIANVANITTLNTSNVTTTGNITANNVTVNLELAGNTANFSGNVKFNANANVTNNLGVGGNITTSGAGGNITMTGGNFSGANVIFANTANISLQLNGNTANFTGNVTAANFIGTFANGGSNVIIANSGNISFSVSPLANVVTFSNVGIDTIGYVTANGNITSNTGFVSNNVTAFANTTLTLAAGAAAGSANINVILQPTGNGTVDVSSKRITSLATPTQDSDAATKAYVDSVAQGLAIKTPVYAATYAALPAYTYNNGTAGVGATITANAFGALVVDGQTISTLGTRVLVKNETAGNAAYNGIYTLTTAGGVAAYFVLTRSLDMNVSTEFDGAFVFVQTGSANADTGWVQTADNPTIGTTAIVWVQFSGAGQYSANTNAGLALNGTVFSAKVDGNTNPTTAFDGNGNIYVPAGAAFTTPNIGAATGTSVDLTGNVLAGNVNSNAKVTAASIEATGNILTNNLTANLNITATGNLSGNNATVTNLLTVSGNANVALTLNGNIANFSGNLTALNANLGNLATANYVNVATQLNGNVANFSGNLTALNANLGNLVTANFANISSNLVVSGTANIANINATGNVLANNITSNNRVSATNVKIGNSYIYANTVTTSSTTPAEICSFMITNTDVYGIEYIIKSFDSAGSKYSMATVQSVTNGTDVDYVTYATVRLGNTTGQLSVTRTSVGPDVSINLIATPSTSNSTVWTTQYRLI
jgi:hypothetical protein